MRDARRHAVAAPSAAYAPVTYSPSRPPTVSGGRSAWPWPARLPLRACSTSSVSTSPSSGPPWPTGVIDTVTSGSAPAGRAARARRRSRCRPPRATVRRRSTCRCDVRRYVNSGSSIGAREHDVGAEIGQQLGAVRARDPVGAGRRRARRRRSRVRVARSNIGTITDLSGTVENESGRNVTCTGSSARSVSGSASTRYVGSRTAGSSAMRDQRGHERHLVGERRQERAPHDRPREQRARARHRRPRERALTRRALLLRVPDVRVARVAARDHQLAARRAREVRRGQRIVDVGEREVVAPDRHAVSDPARARACSPCGRCSRRTPRPRSRAPARARCRGAASRTPRRARSRARTRARAARRAC